MFHLCVHLCTMCTQEPRLDPVELELQVLVRHYGVLGTPWGLCKSSNWSELLSHLVQPNK